MFQLIFFLLHCDESDRVVALPRHKFVTGATLLQLENHVQNVTIHNQDRQSNYGEKKIQ